VQLIPGEGHREIRGYHLLRGDRRVTAQPLAPGANLPLAPAEYRAVAVEWSGLESEPGLPLKVAKAMRAAMLPDAPKDFSWARERWLVGGRASSPATARAAPEAIRRQTFRDGKITLREFFGADGRQISKEIFDAEGFITESIRYLANVDPPTEDDHWWYERGTPVRRVAVRHEFVKQGEDWTARR